MLVELKIIKDGMCISGPSLLKPDTHAARAPVKMTRTAMKIRQIKVNLLNRGIRFVNLFQIKRSSVDTKIG